MRQLPELCSSDKGPCSHGQLPTLPQTKKDLESPSSTCFEARFPYHDSRPMMHSPSPLQGDLTSLVPHERLPELPVVPREKPDTGAAARENYEKPPSSRDEGLRFLHVLESNPESSLQTPQEAGLHLGHSVGSKRDPSPLERRAEFFASTRDEI